MHHVKHCVKHRARNTAREALVDLPRHSVAFSLELSRSGLEKHSDRVFQHTRQSYQELRRSSAIHNTVVGGKG